MRHKLQALFVLAFVLLAASVGARSDTYSTFTKRRYYSADRRYFIEVDEKKRATLYRNGARLEADAASADKCDRLMPYERLRFDAGTGKIIDRSFINRTDKSGG